MEEHRFVATLFGTEKQLRWIRGEHGLNLIPYGTMEPIRRVLKQGQIPSTVRRLDAYAFLQFVESWKLCK